MTQGMVRQACIVSRASRGSESLCVRQGDLSALSTGAN
jgi:hypothetical protein